MSFDVAFLNTLPAAVYAAIILFLLKEGLEWRRRTKADQRKLKVYKQVLAAECERYLWIIKTIQSMKRRVDKRPGAYRIDTDASGRQFFTTLDENGDEVGGSMLPNVRVESIEELAANVAYVDEGLATSVGNALDAALELKHLRDSILDNQNPWDKIDTPDFHESFWDYVDEEAEDAKKAFGELYLACTGKELTSHRVR
ncbi:hypothetical protein [Agrobacterium tumefaciens]|uniref:hypothetical protein n=1 Tax=Agrobacterium tumefaciens TaxID=358 RepID=UPI001573E967|nr:hypothetical protein [Agrobacterium tumefaciens]WCK66819.1 hypothetical protein G6L23_013475 [Agrobacterium tumefaciens]